MNVRILEKNRSVKALSLVIALTTGCFAFAPSPSPSPANPDSPREPPVLHDGIPPTATLISGSPERWEARLREDCERDPAGSACASLFNWAAGRLRANTRTEEAAGLLAHACAQRHAPSCAAVELLRSASLNNAEAMVRSGCPDAFAFPSEECYGAGAVLIHVCNQRHQAAACLQLADLFAKADQPDPVWAKRYRARACKYGNFCSPSDPPKEAPQARGAE